MRMRGCRGTICGGACRNWRTRSGSWRRACTWGGRPGGLAAQLDAVGKSVEMSGGILVADMMEGGTRFALGVSMMLRREAFEKAGGYEDLGQYYAEDFVLGQRLAAQGYGVRMANYVVRLMVLPQGLRASFRDQLRWMKSTRRSRPAGHLGTGLTYAVPFGLLGLAWGLLAGHPVVGLLWLLATCVEPLGDGGGGAVGAGGRAGGQADADLSAARPAGVCGVGGELYGRPDAVSRRDGIRWAWAGGLSRWSGR